ARATVPRLVLLGRAGPSRRPPVALKARRGPRRCGGCPPARDSGAVTHLTSSRARALRWALLAGLLGAAIIVPFVIWEDTLVALSHRWLDSETNRVVVAALAALLLALDLVLPVPSSFVSAGAVAALGPARGALAIW